MTVWQYLERPPWRTILLLVAILFLLGIAYLVWTPGRRINDGRHDMRSNGIWIQHGWLGDDIWFQNNGKDKALFRSSQKIQELSNLFVSHGIKYIFPHVCPCNPSGKIVSIDPVQTERFLDHFEDFSVIPWIGGVLDTHCSPESPHWRENFISSAVELLQNHPRFAGVQINIEPMPTGNADFLALLDEMRRAMPEEKILSVAAYPPPTLWHPFPNVHWDESYFRQVSQRTDQLAVMMYDTAIKLPKVYQYLVSGWTTKILNWSGDTEILLGIPVYADAGVGYHSAEVENLQNALLVIHTGLYKQKQMPKNYAGIAIYCEWEMNQQEWSYLEREFEKNP
jgi:hypothetical protein